MVSGGKLFTQLIRIVLGFICAMLAAGLFLAWGLFQAGDPSQDPAGFAIMVWTAFISASIFGALSMIPAGFAIAFAEIMKWRGVVYHVAAGGLIALVLWSLGGQLPDDPSQPSIRPGSSVATAAGFIAGFAYWIIAGRLSGCWSIKADEEGSTLA